MDDAYVVAALGAIDSLLYNRIKPSRWLSPNARLVTAINLAKGYSIRIVTRDSNNICLVEIEDDLPGTGAVSFYTESRDPIDLLNQLYNQAMSNRKPTVVTTSEF